MIPNPHVVKCCQYTPDIVLDIALPTAFQYTINNLHGTLSPPLIQWCQPLYTFSFCKRQSAYCTIRITDLRSLVLGLHFVHTLCEPALHEFLYFYCLLTDFLGGLPGFWLVFYDFWVVFGWFGWFLAGLGGFWLVWVVFGWFGWFLAGLGGFWLVSNFSSNVSMRDLDLSMTHVREFI